MKNVFFTPRISEDTRYFWEQCKNHKLVFQKCSNCSYVRWPAAYLCPECLSPEYSFIGSEGQGEIYSYVVFKRAFHPDVEKRLPYVVALIDLDCGVRMLSNIVNTEIEKIRCGLKVKIIWSEEDEGFSLPLFVVQDNL
jgi:uncharacterized OB-fold protein